MVPARTSRWAWGSRGQLLLDGSLPKLGTNRTNKNVFGACATKLYWCFEAVIGVSFCTFEWPGGGGQFLLDGRPLPEDLKRDLS